MNKTELVNLLKKLEIPISESTPRDDEMNESVRLCYWDYIWEPITASGEEYNTLVTYQISFIADCPRHPKLLKLRNMLKEKGQNVTISHEYLTEKREVHSFFNLEVLENVE